MVIFDCDVAVAALDCIDNYLDSIAEPPEYNYRAAVGNISGIIMFAHYLSMKRLGYDGVANLREENNE